MSTTARTPHLIVLANEPRLLREMLRRALDRTPGVIVVEESSDLNKLAEIFRQVQIDWLVITLNGDQRLTAQAHQLLTRLPSLSLLALAVDGSRLEVRIHAYQRGILKYLLEDISLTTLLSILRYKYGDRQIPPVLHRVQ